MTLFALVGVDRGQLLFAAFHRTSPLLMYLRIVAGITRLYWRQELSVQHTSDGDLSDLAQLGGGGGGRSSFPPLANFWKVIQRVALGAASSIYVQFGHVKNSATQKQAKGKLTMVVCSSNFSFGSSFSAIVIRRAHRGQIIVVCSFPRAFSQECEA